MVRKLVNGSRASCSDKVTQAAGLPVAREMVRSDSNVLGTQPVHVPRGIIMRLFKKEDSAGAGNHCSVAPVPNRNGDS